MNIYISSSWKQRERVRALAVQLRAAGHEVYDFTDPNCRTTPEIPPEKFPEQFDPEKHVYGEYLRAVPEWHSAVMCNHEALIRCDVCVLLLPCGNDAHADWAFAHGIGAKTAVVGQPRAGERTPSHLWADAILMDEPEVLVWLESLGVKEADLRRSRRSNCVGFAAMTPLRERIEALTRYHWDRDNECDDTDPNGEHLDRSDVLAALDEPWIDEPEDPFADKSEDKDR